MSEASYPKIYLYKRLVEAKQYIDRHFAERIDLNNIAGAAYFSKYHFLRLFKKTYGRTPHQYLTSLRIERAKELLSADMPCGEVCLALGFESLSSFTRLFKRHVKLTPAEYAAKARQMKDSIAKEPLNHVPQCFAEKLGWLE